MGLSSNKLKSWSACHECQGLGKKSTRIKKKIRLKYQRELEEFENSKKSETLPVQPKAHLSRCTTCSGSGLTRSDLFPKPDNTNYPTIAIIGGGIGGIALAVACLHRGIPFSIFERDCGFDARAQGYGLTLQQASKAIESLGIFQLENSVVSTRHVVHTTEGKVVGEWGMRKWMQSETTSNPRRTNIHIARQSLRLSFLEQLESLDSIHWGHQFVGFRDCGEKGLELNFLVNGEDKAFHADFIVGADGIRSSVRNLILKEEDYPLRYLGCIVILGICPLASLGSLESDLLDSETVFQTANGNERIYMMPYSKDTIMWQLSFPISEKEAKILSKKGTIALKEEACRRTQWHEPIPQILSATKVESISGYPVYDREILKKEDLDNVGNITLIGDAAHPMSPFKGQGANQAILDALTFARGIVKGCRPLSKWRELGLRKSVVDEFEIEMIKRSATKVKDSAEAAKLLHSEKVLQVADEPRGRLKKED